MRRVIIAIAAILLLTGAWPARAQQRRLAEFDVPVLGVSGTVEPSAPVFPKNVASAVRVVLKSGTQELSQADVRAFIGAGSVAKAELSGPGVGQTLTLPLPDIAPSDPLFLPIPALSVAGDYTL